MKSKITQIDEVVLDTLKGKIVIEGDGTTHVVPVVYKDGEVILEVISQQASEAEEAGLKPSHLLLPSVTVNRVGIELGGVFDRETTFVYEVKVFTLYQEEMNQIVEQILVGFPKKTSYGTFALDAVGLGNPDEHSRIMSSKFMFTISVNLKDANNQ